MLRKHEGTDKPVREKRIIQSRHETCELRPRFPDTRQYSFFHGNTWRLSSQDSFGRAPGREAQSADVRIRDSPSLSLSLSCGRQACFFFVFRDHETSWVGPNPFPLRRPIAGPNLLVSYATAFYTVLSALASVPLSDSRNFWRLKGLGILTPLASVSAREIKCESHQNTERYI